MKIEKLKRKNVLNKRRVKFYWRLIDELLRAIGGLMMCGGLMEHTE